MECQEAIVGIPKIRNAQLKKHGIPDIWFFKFQMDFQDFG
jgi:hypothetical protein